MHKNLQSVQTVKRRFQMVFLNTKKFYLKEKFENSLNLSDTLLFNIMLTFKKWVGGVWGMYWVKRHSVFLVI